MSQHEFPGLSKPVTAEQRAAYDLVKERDGLRERAEKAEAELRSVRLALSDEAAHTNEQHVELERLKEGIREAASILDLICSAPERRARDIQSWLAAYYPIPTDRAVLHGEEETKP